MYKSTFNAVICLKCMDELVLDEPPSNLEYYARAYHIMTSVFDSFDCTSGE